MKRKVNVKKTVKVFEVQLVLIILATLFMSIAFANISDIKLNVTAIVQEGVFISDVTRTNVDGYITDEIKYYRKTALSTTIELESRPQIVEGEIGPYITYTVSLYNNSGDDYYYAGLSYDEYAYDNTNITAVVDTLKPYITTIHPREELKFNLTFQYVDGVTASSNQQLNSILNFDFLNDYIEFTLDGKKYIAPNEITWEQFIESEYNTDSFKIQNDKIYTSGNKCILLEETPVALEDKITKDAKYIKENIDITLTMNTEDTLTQGESAIYTMSASSNGGKIEENNVTATVLNNSNKEVGTATIEQGVYKIYGNSIQNGTPKPETPIEVESVGDKTKNLFNNDTSLLEQVTYYTSSGSTGTRIGYKILLPPGTYTAHAEGTANTQYIYGCINSSAGEFISTAHIVVHNELRTQTFTINEGDILYLYNGSSNLVVNVAKELFSSFNIQIEEGSTATDYEPYGKYKIPVKVSGKNLFNKDNFVDGTQEKRQYDEDGNEVIFYRDANGALSNFLSRDIEFKENTVYTLSLKIKASNGVRIPRIGIYYTDGTYQVLDKTPNNNEYNYYSITSQSGKTISKIGSENAWGVYGYILMNSIQIEEGSTATDYESPAIIKNIYLNEPLRKVGNASDYIDLETGQVVRNIKTFEFTSNTNLTTYTWNNKVGVYAYIGLDNAYSRIPGLSNRNNVFVSSLDAETSMWIGVNNRNLFWLGILDYLGFEDDETTTAVEKLKAWLANNPTYVYYATSTPDYTETVNIPEFNITSDYTTVEVLTEVAPSSIEAAVGSAYRIKVDTSALSAGTYKIKVPAKAFVTENNTYSEQAISTGKFTVELVGADNTIS